MGSLFESRSLSYSVHREEYSQCSPNQCPTTVHLAYSILQGDPLMILWLLHFLPRSPSTHMYATFLGILPITSEFQAA